MENYAATKGRLFASKPKFIVLNRDDDWFSFFDKYKAAGRKLSYGTSEYADVRIKHVKLYRKGSEATVAYSDQKDIELATAMPGRFNVYNMAAAVTVALALNIDSDNITEGVANLEGVPGRFERVVEGKDYDVIVDYAHTPDALEKLLAAARDVTRGRIILVFGATGDRDKAKRPIMGEIAVSGSDKIILTDDETYTENPQGIRDMVMEGIKNAKGESKTEEIGDRRDAIAKALSIVKSGDTILITGMGHERFRIMNEGREAWNDADTVRDILESNNN